MFQQFLAYLAGEKVIKPFFHVIEAPRFLTGVKNYYTLIFKDYSGSFFQHIVIVTG